VANAEDPSNYEIKISGETTQNISSIVYFDDYDNYYALISLTEPVYAAKYSITTYNITDNSIEQNPIPGPFTKKTEGVWLLLFYLRWVFQNLWWALIIMAFAAVFFISYRIIKKRKGLVKMEGKLIFSDRIEKKQVVNLIDNSKKTHLTLHINGKNSFNTDIRLHGSIIIGRSDICDIKINDNKMSRQHFSLENTENGLILSDLQTTNGTFVNGVKVMKPRKIELGDTITAGSCDLVFTGG